MTTEEIIKLTVEHLKKGRTILYPTDTVLGIGCNAFDNEACKKIIKIKRRPPMNSFVCLVSSDAMLNTIIPEIPSIAWDLFDESTSPLTLVLPNAKKLAKSTIAIDGSAAIRLIKKGPLHKIIHQFGKPIVSTSANLSGEMAAKKLDEVNTSILNSVDYIVDPPNFPAGTNKASSIIKVGLGNQIKIIRP